MTIHPSRLIEVLGSSRAALLGTDRAEVRSLSIIVFALFFYQLAEPGFYTAFVEESLTHRIAGMGGDSLWFALGFFTAASMLIPHLLNLAFFPDRLGHRLPRLLAGYATLLAAVLWAVLGVRAWPLDYEWLSVVWMVRASVDLCLGVVLGVSLNAQQAREAYEDALRVKREQEEKAGIDHAEESAR